MLYSGNKNKHANWIWNVGIRVTINTIDSSNYKPRPVYYQTGYAYKPWEYLGVMGNINRKVIAKDKWRLDVYSELFIVRERLMYRTSFLNAPLKNTFTNPSLSIDLILDQNFHISSMKIIKFHFMQDMGFKGDGKISMINDLNLWV